ncbi:prepilin-type N-terminal cleavage/methylation domain-containing protein [Neobacillus dielmonensis]|uniref:prepilin-type N-terminal cleavage/methylation domain-containing protein n=1 Tax=Neobacillus dielmonensis TaxID=1347369 RepID=UPI0005A671FC|nr:type II secretion system protein [Neobacillus dielmonensis]
MIQAIKQKMKEQKGFTLIELLAVIVILGIIAAIAIPAIGNVINKSHDKAEAQEGVQIINAAKMYMANENTIPWGTTTSTSSRATLTEQMLKNYLDHVKATGFYVEIEKTASGKYTYKLFDHPAADSGGTDEQTLVNNANR